MPSTTKASERLRELELAGVSLTISGDKFIDWRVLRPLIADVVEAAEQSGSGKFGGPLTDALTALRDALGDSQDATAQ